VLLEVYYQNVMHYTAYKGISIECDVSIRHFMLYFQSSAVVETLEKNSSEMVQNFWVRFSITPIHFQWFDLGQQ